MSPFEIAQAVSIPLLAGFGLTAMVRPDIVQSAEIRYVAWREPSEFLRDTLVGHLEQPSRRIVLRVIGAAFLLMAGVLMAVLGRAAALW